MPRYIVVRRVTLEIVPGRASTKLGGTHMSGLLKVNLQVQPQRTQSYAPLAAPRLTYWLQGKGSAPSALSEGGGVKKLTKRFIAMWQDCGDQNDGSAIGRHARGVTQADIALMLDENPRRFFAAETLPG
jgi:hypothetical protein